MQGSRHTSLNGVRAFEAAARLGSLKAAAGELGVTASAISHQVRQLEAAVGVKLFARRHNLIELTPDGTSFYADVAPAIHTIIHARQALQRDATSLVVKSHPTFAIRWLVPRLQDFHARYPRVRVSVETTTPPVLLSPGVDVALPFARKGGVVAGGVPLLVDWALPVRSPRLEPVGALKSAAIPYPIIAVARDYWEWLFYVGELGINFESLQISSRFDTDDAAARAAITGFGVSLQTRAFIDQELASGDLVGLSGLDAIEFGTYWMVEARPRRPATDTFTRWLRRQAARSVV